MGVECNRPDGAGLVAEMMLGGVGIFKAAPPGGAFAFHDEIFGGAERNSIFGGEFFRAWADQHHMLAFFIPSPSKADRVANMLEGGYGASFQRGAVHQNGIELNAAIAVQVRADA